MIAAALAAMVGGVEAATYAYNFSASVKTTKAKQGNNTVKCQFAQNATGNWWYEDAVFATQSLDKNGNPIANTYDYTSTSGNVYPKALKINARTGVGTLSLRDNVGKMELADDLASYNVPEIRRGKPYWCLTFTYKSEDCVRVAGSRKLAWYYTINDCCADPTFTAKTPDPTKPAEVAAALPDLEKSLLYRFGSLDYAKATKLEFAGWMGAKEFDAATIGQKQSSASAIVLHLAGQGTWAKLKDSDRNAAEGISSISGNIVGVLPNDICDICCGAKNWDYVFDCCGDAFDPAADAYSYDAATIANDEGWETAAFGTFTLKFNAKESSL